jgi:hypothetical protein
MAGVNYVTTAPQRIENNLIIGKGAGDSTGVLLGGTSDVRMKGNIVLNFTRAFVAQNVSVDKPTVIKACDYNVFGGLSAIAILGRYSTVTSKTYNDFAAWKAGVSTDTPILGMNGPDINGVQSTPGTIVADLNAGDYTLPASSPAKGIMPDGSNAGPYQTGSEVIGIRKSTGTNPPPMAPALSVQ